MTVYFIGAGPGAADLMTLRGAKIMGQCDVILYAGSLIPQELLAHGKAGAKLINTASMSLEEIISAIQSAHEKQLTIARLQSGDLSIYSALSEQLEMLQALNIPYELVPGVPAFGAASSALQMELTKANQSQSLIITRPGQKASPLHDKERLEQLAKTKATLAIHLGAKSAEYIMEALIPSYGANCPTFIAANVSQDNEQLIKTVLSDLGQCLEQASIRKTAIIFVGAHLGTISGSRSKLYDKDYNSTS